jgi:hypothetical protein
LEAANSHDFSEGLEKRSTAELELKKLYLLLDRVKNLPLPELPELNGKVSMDELEVVSSLLEDFHRTLNMSVPNGYEYDEFLPHDEEEVGEEEGEEE